ncbi:hypothetical protein Pmar_PMAR021432 [Perkinsus marinus ATCC 50983]|uniref:Uncharacterized protein n=1 Tax=Perkinsus marinus (strain ATCC 50983 / TXsc) TaxID=423536 RepID=C5KX97_PERM5|nr:hypothetical protein Pmar_PMAR021432 [Perkinsus marinus ATCC 50983]EER10953.1 hypothetical protein Pmar_PMAR021432 [Perkinsus marinus ATCC 50983]|eukprot:XP_002779158.1 hypothetical protein Pmar_PMAR021432 [Perkinsus marinus ATCC 50983]
MLLIGGTRLWVSQMPQVALTAGHALEVACSTIELTIAKIEGWFKKFETIAKFYNWGEKAYEYVPLFLEDKVQVAYDHIPLSDRTGLNKVKASLIHSLLTQDPFEAFNSRVMNDDESYLDFSYDLKQLAKKMLSVERAKTISRGKEISDQRKQELSFYAGYYSAHYGGKGKGKSNYNVKGGKGGKGFKGSPGKGYKGKGPLPRVSICRRIPIGFTGVILVDELAILPGTAL